MDYHWPGNVRQLEGFIRVLVQSGRQEIVEPPQALSDEAPESGDNGGDTKLRDKVKRLTENFVRTEIERALRRFDGSRKKAAAYLGISYRDLLYKMKKYGLRDRF
jgi:two-component system response regulator AtoC